jgi:hypothetical protein
MLLDLNQVRRRGGLDLLEAGIRDHRVDDPAIARARRTLDQTRALESVEQARDP